MAELRLVGLMAVTQMILFGLLAVACITGLVLQQVFYSRLRRSHPDIWAELGKPAVFANSGFANIARFQRFLWSRQYEDWPDLETVRLARILRGLYVVYFTLFAITIVVFMLALQK